MDFTAWLLVFLIIAVAAFTLTVTGFGYALVASSLLLLILEPRTVVVYNLFLGIILSLPILWQCRHSIRSRQLLLPGISSIFGLPLGTYIISQVSANILKLLIAILVVVFAIVLALGYSYRLKRERLGSVVVGFIGGVLMPSTSLGGPPVVLFLLNQGCDKDSFRTGMIVFLTFCGVGALIALGISGVVTGSLLASSLTFIPALAIGFCTGNIVRPHMKTSLFRRIAIAIVLLTGIVAIVNAISSLV